MPINVVDRALKTRDPKNDIPDPAHRSWGGFLKHQVLKYGKYLCGSYLAASHFNLACVCTDPKIGHEGLEQ